VASFATGVKLVAQNSFGWDGVKDDRGRKLLQDVGGVGREYNKDLWVSHTIDRIIPSNKHYPLDFVFVDDWRFPNEWEYIKKNGLYSVYAIRLHAPNREMLLGKPTYNDVSEVSLDSFDKFNSVIDNTVEMVELKLKLVSLFNEIEKIENNFGGK
jgi:hypothetical protein